jgi:hypothetical protein
MKAERACCIFRCLAERVGWLCDGTEKLYKVATSSRTGTFVMLRYITSATPDGASSTTGRKY